MGEMSHSKHAEMRRQNSEREVMRGEASESTPKRDVGHRDDEMIAYVHGRRQARENHELPSEVRIIYPVNSPRKRRIPMAQMKIDERRKLIYG